MKGDELVFQKQISINQGHYCCYHRSESGRKMRLKTRAIIELPQYRSIITRWWKPQLHIGNWKDLCGLMSVESFDNGNGNGGSNSTGGRGVGEVLWYQYIIVVRQKFIVIAKYQ